MNTSPMYTLMLTLLACIVLSTRTPEADELPVAEDAAAFDELSLGELLTMKLSTGSFLELDLKKSPMSMTVISSEMVRTSGARHMSELLEIFVPGFVYNINKYYGAVWAMRGVSNDRNTKVVYLVNGHKMNTQARDGFQGETTLGLLGDIERVEVLRGPAGLVYGSGAIAGIINVVTRKGDANGSSVAISASGDGSRSIEANLAGAPTERSSFMVTAGVRYSDGFPLATTRIYSRGNKVPGQLGVPSDGRYGSTDGNWKFTADLTIDNFGFYLRSTRQKENTASCFPFTPWPDKLDAPQWDTVWNSREVDGVMVSQDDPFWGEKNNGRQSRKQYLSDNIMSEASYHVPIGENELKTIVSFDMNTTSILEEDLEQYRLDFKYKNGRNIETFGEKRYMATATYLLRSVEGLQAALGAEYRLDQIGNSMNGKNEQLWNPKHFIVNETNYQTFTFLGEGFYDITEQWGAYAGLRIDMHTRAKMFSPKAALVYRPTTNHSIKLIYQSAANNGSADNYEYSRDQVDNNGMIRTEPILVDKDKAPTATSRLRQPAELIEMHSLRPEYVHSIEAAYVGKLPWSVTLETSVSLNMVKDLFVWESSLFRVTNAGTYKFANIDLVARYDGSFIKCGINHTLQRPVYTDVGKQEKIFKLYQLRDSVTASGDTVYGYFNGVDAGGESVYIPLYEKSGEYPINLVKNSVTFDGKHFTNLPTNMTKLYMMLMPFDWLTLSTNLRVIWGVPGRKQVVESDDPGVNSVPDDGNYFGYYGEKEAEGIREYLMTMVAKKWNAGLTFHLVGDLDASFYVYNILGTDRHDFSENEADRSTVNTLRLQHMYSFRSRDMYSVDQRTFGVSFSKSL